MRCDVLIRESVNHWAALEAGLLLPFTHDLLIYLSQVTFKLQLWIVPVISNSESFGWRGTCNNIIFVIQSFLEFASVIEFLITTFGLIY